MAEPTSKPKGRFDPLTGAAVAFFLLAVAFAAAPALDAGPATLASMMLLIGLAGVSCLGLFVLRTGAEPAPDSDQGAETFLQALDAAVTRARSPGRVIAAACSRGRGG